MTFRMVLVLGVIASSVWAQRVSFPSFTGPGASSVRNQLVGAICDQADCVAATKTTTNNKPDWKKARKESVPFIVTGNVVKKGKNLTLDLQVLTKAGPPRARKSFALDKNGSLAAKTLQGAIDVLKGAFDAGGEKPGTEPVATPPPDTTPSPVEKNPPPKDEPRRTDKPKTQPPPPAREDPDPTGSAPAPAQRKTQKPKFLHLTVGADIVTRRLVYSQVATPNLRRYDLPPVGQPVIGVQFFPLALVRDDLLAGLGVDLSIGFAPWIQSRLINAGDPFPTSTVRFDGGLRFDIIPSRAFPIAITPMIGIRSHSFSVGALADGRRIDGLPNVSYLGLRAGLGVEIPIIVDRLSIFGHAAIIPVFSSGEILSSAFFPNGSTFGFEANGGVGVQILSFLSIRGSFEFINYGLTFKTQTGDTYVAAGAADTWLGGNASLRLSF